MFVFLGAVMPRNYKPVVGTGYKQHEPGKIQQAILDLQNGLSLRKTAEKHGIHYSVLYRHWKKGTGTGNVMKKSGGQTSLSADEETLFVQRLQLCSEWGYPIDSITLRLLVKDFLDRSGRIVKKFKDNLPGRDYVYGFLQRHRDELAIRICQNIKRSRASITPNTINAYFDELTKELEGVPVENIVNYDETNLTDDPGRRKVITRRGTKYPERVMNSSKASTSVMFSASAKGTILPPYVVYKSIHLYHSWTEGGPKGTRYNRTKSGWFDAFCFDDWVSTVALPYFNKLEGKKILIGDNLASHLSLESIRLCEASNVRFIFLPANSTHLTQPLDVAFFRPLKMKWREILEEWKKGMGRNEPTVPKDKFPALLKKLCDSLKEANVVSGFKKCGIAPLNRTKVLEMLPGEKQRSQPPKDQQQAEAIDNTFKDLLMGLRQDQTPKMKTIRTKVKVQPGKSIGVEDFNQDAGENSGSTGNETEKLNAPSKEDISKKIKRNGNPLKKQYKESDDEDDITDFMREMEHEEEEDRREQMLLTIAEGKGNMNELLNLEPVVKKVGEYVIFTYEEEFFPGRIISFDEHEVTISSMQKSLKSWKWPPHEDVHKYDWEDVMGRINPPKLISKRGFFEIPELKYVWE